MHIFLDLDGVLADFDAHALACFGIACGDINVSRAQMNDAQKAREDELYRGMYEHPDFFGSMPVMKDALDLVAEAERIDRGFRILTAAPAPRDFAPDIFERAKASKLAWCARHLGLFEERVIVCRSKDKHLQVGRPPGIHVLVDDRPLNIHRWTEAGGTGILHSSAAGSIAALSVAALAPMQDDAPSRDDSAPAL